MYNSPFLKKWKKLIWIEFGVFKVVTVLFKKFGTSIRFLLIFVSRILLPIRKSHNLKNYVYNKMGTPCGLQRGKLQGVLKIILWSE